METLKCAADVRAYIKHSMIAKDGVYESCISDILAAADLIANAFKNGNKLMLCGNGGSAADCQHMAAELVPQGLPAIALTTDTSFLTAFSNDYCFENVFAMQIDAIGTPGDVLLGITTSGKSRNVITAIHMASHCDLKSIALTGAKGLDIPEHESDLVIKVPSMNTQHIQESHIMIEHIICELVLGHVQSN